ncbi:MAG: hypothetical protein LBB36_00785, partial [Fibromonadaceae bacterium]|nr:hypothetical protein [Fibromonadaceae bacterium]
MKIRQKRTIATLKGKGLFASFLTALCLLLGTQTAWGAYAPCEGDYAGYFCQWDFDCWDINQGPDDDESICESEYNNCIKYGYLFSGVTDPGAGKICSATGTFIDGKDDDYETVDNSIQCEGYCQWLDGCFRISTDPDGKYNDEPVLTCEQARSNCTSFSLNETIYDNVTCTDTSIPPPPLSTNTFAEGVLWDNENCKDIEGYLPVNVGFSNIWMAEDHNGFTGQLTSPAIHNFHSNLCEAEGQVTYNISADPLYGSGATIQFYLADGEGNSTNISDKDGICITYSLQESRNNIMFLRVRQVVPDGDGGYISSLGYADYGVYLPA